MPPNVYNSWTNLILDREQKGDEKGKRKPRKGETRE